MARFLDFSLDPRLGKESSKQKSFYYAFNNVPVVSTRFVSLWASRSFPSFWNATIFALISFLWMSFSIKLAFISDNKVSCCPNAFCTYYIRRRGQEKGTKTIKVVWGCEPVVVRVIGWGSFYCVTIVYYGMLKQCSFCLQSTETFLSCFWREELSVNKKKNQNGWTTI